ncbi:MAG: hypothetical protein Sw2LagBPW_38420 [Shewanella algae]
MKTVSLFASKTLEIGSARQARLYQAGRIGYQLMRGAKGVNPVLVWVDAAISVLDCLNSYFKLQRAKEVTEQLQVQKRTLQHQLKNLSKQMALEQTLWQMEAEERLTLLQHRLQHDNHLTTQLVAELQSRRQSLELFLGQLQHLRSTARRECPELRRLSRLTDELMKAQLLCLVSAFE